MSQFSHDVFISYSSKDTNIANTFMEIVEARGVKCWLAERDIKQGTIWANEIDEAIHSAKIFVVIISKNSVISKQVPKEIGLAVNSCQMLIPLRVDAVELEGAFRYYLSDCQWVDATSEQTDKMNEVADVIERVIQPEKMEEKTADSKSEAKAEETNKELNDSDKMKGPEGNSEGSNKKQAGDDSLKVSINKKLIGIIAAIVALIAIIGIAVALGKSKEPAAQSQVSEEQAAEEQVQSSDEESSSVDWMAGKSIETLYITRNDKIDDDGYNIALEKLKLRLDDIFGEAYSLVQIDDYYTLQFATDSLGEVNINDLLQYHVFRPEELFIVKNPREYYKIERTGITGAVIQDGIPQGCTIKDSENETDFRYIEVSLDPSTSAQLQGNMSKWEKSGLLSGLSMVSAITEYTREDQSAMENAEEEETKELRLEACTDFNMLIDGSIASSKMWSSDYTVVSSDYKKVCLVMKNASDVGAETIVRNLTSETFEPAFLVTYETCAIWDTEEKLASEDRLEWGTMQVNAEYFRENNLISYDMIYQKSNTEEETYGDWYDAREAMQKKLDGIGLKYALGTLSEDSYAIVIKVEAKYAGSEFAGLVTTGNMVNINPYDSSRGKTIKYDADDQYMTLSLDSCADSVKMENGKIIIALKSEEKLGETYTESLNRLINEAAKYGDSCNINWGLFYGSYDEASRSFIFEKSRYTVDNRIPEECEYMIKLYDYKLHNGSRNSSYYNAKNSYVVYNTLDEIRENEPVVLSDKSGEVICEKIKESIVSVIGVEPEMTYENGSCRIHFTQTISDKYATNIFRITDALMDAPIYEYNGINTLPSDAKVFLNFYDTEDRIQARVIVNRDAKTSFSEHEKEITIVFWSANVTANKLEVLEDQIFALKDLFENDPKFEDYYVSITKSMQ